MCNHKKSYFEKIYFRHLKDLINFPEKLIGGFLIVPEIFPCFLKYYLYCTTNTKNYLEWEVLGEKNSTSVEKRETTESRAGWWEDREHAVRKNSRNAKQVTDFSLANWSRLNKLGNYQ